MTMNFVTGKDAKDILKEKLLSGWIIVIGDNDGIGKLEWEIYTPGTPKNADFEMISFMPSLVFIGKKTDDLRQLLGNPPEFDRLIGLEFRGKDEKGESCKRIVCREDTEACVSEIVSQVTKGW